MLIIAYHLILIIKKIVRFVNILVLDEGRTDNLNGVADTREKSLVITLVKQRQFFKSLL